MFSININYFIYAYDKISTAILYDVTPFDTNDSGEEYVSPVERTFEGVGAALTIVLYIPLLLFVIASLVANAISHASGPDTTSNNKHGNVRRPYVISFFVFIPTIALSLVRIAGGAFRVAMAAMDTDTVYGVFGQIYNTTVLLGMYLLFVVVAVNLFYKLQFSITMNFHLQERTKKIIAIVTYTLGALVTLAIAIPVIMGVVFLYLPNLENVYIICYVLFFLCLLGTAGIICLALIAVAFAITTRLAYTIYKRRKSGGVTQTDGMERLLLKAIGKIWIIDILSCTLMFFARFILVLIAASDAQSFWTVFLRFPGFYIEVPIAFGVVWYYSFAIDDTLKMSKRVEHFADMCITKVYNMTRKDIHGKNNASSSVSSIDEQPQQIITETTDATVGLEMT